MRKSAARAVIAGVGIVALAACSLQSTPGGKGEDGPQQDPQAPITLLTHPTIYKALGGETLVDEFTKASGIKVKVVTADIGPHLDKLMADYKAGTAAYDVVALQNVDYMPRVTKGLLPLDDLIKGAGGEWNWEDFIESTRSFAAVEGIQYGVPVRLGTQMLYYRKDLLQQAGLKPPETFDEYSSAAAALTTKSVHGAVQRGIPRELANDWLGFFYSAGGSLLTKDGGCGINGPEGAAATDLMRSLFSAGSLPRDFFAWGRDNYISAMQQGNAAMGVYFSPYLGLLTKKTDSKVADRLGYALAPVDGDVPPGTSRAQTWNLSISGKSKNRDGAWKFIQTATSVENSLRSGIKYANGPVRTSTYQDADYAKRNPAAQAWLKSANLARVDPPIDELPQMIDIISTQVTAAINGSQPVDAALDQTCKNIEQLVG